MTQLLDGKHLRFMSLSLLIATASACSRNDPAAAPTGIEAESTADNWLKVSNAADDLRQAQVRSAQQTSDESGDILAHPERIWYVDEETERLLKENRKQVIPKLVTALQSGDADARTRSASLLIRLRDPRGRDVLLQELQSSSADARVSALHEVNDLHEIGDEQPHLEHLFAAPKAAELVLETLDSSDPQVQKAAIQACGIANVPGHVEKFRRLIHQEGYADRGRIAYWLAVNGDPEAAVDEIARFFRQGMTEDDAYWTVNAFTELADRGDEQVASRIVKLVQEYYRRTDLDRTKLDSSVGWQLTSLVAEHADKDSAPWLRSQLSQLASAYQKGDILRAYARVDGDGWRELLFSSLHGDLKPYAASVLGDKLAVTEDAEAVRRLSGSLQETDSEETIAAVCESLIEIGGKQAREVAARWADRAGPWQRMDLTWKLNGWTLDSVKPIVVASGFMTEDEYHRAKQSLEREGEEDHPESDLMGLLYVGERMLVFDVETGEIPCRHDQLLQEFAAVSDGVFAPKNVSQEWRNRKGEEDFEADYTLRFVYGYRLYEVHLQNLGDWYAVERLVTAVNAALEQAGREERYIPLHSDGQFAHFIFGKEKAISSLAESLKLPVDDDVTRAMRGGKEFEERVLKKYRDQGEVVE